MTGLERQHRYLAKCNAPLAAENPPDLWFANVPGPEAFGPLLTMNEMLALVAKDSAMTAELQAELDAWLAELEKQDQ